MKKTILASFLSFLLILSSFVLCFADITSPNPYVTYEGEKGSQLWSNKTPTISNSYLISYDALNLIYADLVQQGWPCRLTSILISGNSYFYIVGTGKVTVQSDLGTVGHDTVSYDITGRCFAIASGTSSFVDHPVIARSPQNDTYGGTYWIIQKLNTIISSLDRIEGYIDQIESYIDGLESYLSSQINYLDTITARMVFTDSNGNTRSVANYLNSIFNHTSNISNIYDSVRNGIWVTGYSSYSDDTAYPIAEVRPEVMNQIVAYLNSNFMGQQLRYLDRDSDHIETDASWRFAGAFVVNHRLRIRAESASGNNGLLSFVTPQHYFIDEDSSYVPSSSFYSVLSNIETAISNMNVNSNTSNTHNSNVILKFDSLISATADIDANLDSLVGNIDISLGSIVDSMNIGFDDVVGAIEGIPAANVSSLVPYVDQLESYSDGIEGLISTNNSSLTSIDSSLGELSDSVVAIQEWLESRDVLDYAVIRDLINAWGSSVSYTVLNSNNILGLFHSAFGDVPTSIDWGAAKGYFDNFYSGVS